MQGETTDTFFSDSRDSSVYKFFALVFNENKLTGFQVY